MTACKGKKYRDSVFLLRDVLNPGERGRSNEGTEAEVEYNSHH